MEQGTRLQRLRLWASGVLSLLRLRPKAEGAGAADAALPEVQGVLPDAAKTGKHLKQTALRDFGPPLVGPEPAGKWYRYQFGLTEAPVPLLLLYVLRLVGFERQGPAEKIAWWVAFTYCGEPCVLSHEKFGLRLRLQSAAAEDEAQKTLNQIVKKLRSSTRIVEKMILASAPDLLGRGEATVVNQHASLLAAYEYFRRRALEPAVIEDETVTHEPTDGLMSMVTFKFGQLQMSMNAFHDLVAAITAYLSRLEHDLVLALAFSEFDPAVDNLTAVIGSRWREKFDRVFGKGEDATRYRERLAAVVERWRNPYAHGGFEKGHDATIYLHVPDAGGLPVGLSSVHKSPVFSFIPASDSDIAQVFDLFDDLDRWIASVLPEATKWISSGLPVSFDRIFRSTVASAIDEDEFDQYLDIQAHYQDIAMNMDY